MRLGRLPEIVPHFLVGPVQRPLLFAGGPPRRAASGGRSTGGATENTRSLFCHRANTSEGDDAAGHRAASLAT